MERPSQKLIAKRLGISTAAVSLALRGKGTVSKQLISRVQKMAEEIGYRPNPILSSLASKRFRETEANLGVPIVVINCFKAKVGADQYTHRLRARADELGYSLSVITPYDLCKYSNPAKTLYNRGVQGIALVGSMVREPFDLTKDFDWSEFSVVQCGRFLEPLGFDIVRPNIFQSIKLIYHSVKEKGYRRIGFYTGHHTPILEDDESRLSAVLGLQQIEDSGTDLVPPCFEPLDEPKKLIAWVEKYKPDCVIGFTMREFSLLLDAGYRIPEDFGFASLHINGNEMEFGTKHYVVAGLQQNGNEIALQCINALDQSIRHHIKGQPEFPRHILISSTWQDGNTIVDQ